MAARGPQNGQTGLFGHFRQLLLNKFFDPICRFMRNVMLEKKKWKREEKKWKMEKNGENGQKIKTHGHWLGWREVQRVAMTSSP